MLSLDIIIYLFCTIEIIIENRNCYWITLILINIFQQTIVNYFNGSFIIYFLFWACLEKMGESNVLCFLISLSYFLILVFQVVLQFSFIMNITTLLSGIFILFLLLNSNKVSYNRYQFIILFIPVFYDLIVSFIYLNTFNPNFFPTSFFGFDIRTIISPILIIISISLYSVPITRTALKTPIYYLIISTLIITASFIYVSERQNVHLEIELTSVFYSLTTYLFIALDSFDLVENSKEEAKGELETLIQTI